MLCKNQRQGTGIDACVALESQSPRGLGKCPTRDSPPTSSPASISSYTPGHISLSLSLCLAPCRVSTQIFQFGL